VLVFGAERPGRDGQGHRGSAVAGPVMQDEQVSTVRRPKDCSCGKIKAIIRNASSHQSWPRKSNVISRGAFFARPFGYQLRLGWGCRESIFRVFLEFGGSSRHPAIMHSRFPLSRGQVYTCEGRCGIHKELHD